MKIGCRTRKITGASALLALLAACGGGGGPSYDPDSPEGAAFEYRQAVMRVAGAKLLTVGQMAREEIELDEAGFVQAASDLAALSAMMMEGFENETVVAESRADPAIWENPEDFEQSMNTLVESAAELAEAAETGGFEAARGLVQGTTQNCSGCHRTYRLPEQE